MDNYTASVSQVEKHLRISLSRSQMERLTKYYAEQAEQEDEVLDVAQLSLAKQIKEEVVEEGNAYCMIDGSMLQTREGEKNNDWKEVKLGRIFTDKG